MSLPALDLINEKTLRGSFYGSGNPAAELPGLSSAAGRQIDLAGAVSEFTDLEGIEAASAPAPRRGRQNGGRGRPRRGRTELIVATLAAIAACIAIAWLALVAALVILRAGHRADGDGAAAPRRAQDAGWDGEGSRPYLRTVRLRLWLVILYLMMPFDIVPDVIPIVGYADDAILIAWVIRATIRRGGSEALARHWPGSADGLALVTRLAAG